MALRILFFIVIFLTKSAYAQFSKETEYAWICPHTNSVSAYSVDPSSTCPAAGTACKGFNPSIGLIGVYKYDYAGHNCSVVGSGGTYGALTLTMRNQCPENSNLLNGKCTCISGFVQNGYACEPKGDSCEELFLHCKSYKGTEQDWAIPKITSRPKTVCYKPISILVGADGGTLDRYPDCNKGCNLETAPGVVKYEDGLGETYVKGYGVFVGTPCDLDVKEPSEENSNDTPKAETPDASCPNGFKGEVNGVTICAPAKSAEGIIEVEVKDNGDGTKTESETKVKCEGGKCEVTKTSTTTNTENNSTVSSSSVTTTVDKTKFCSENKKEAVCLNEQGEEDGDGKFGGSCAAGFTCEGDAVMCAMAKEQHKRSCDTLEPVKDGIFKQIQDGTDSGSAEAMKDEAGTINISTQLDTNGYGLPRSCPADPVIELVFVGKSFSIPFSKVCPILKPMSDIALLITALGLLVWLVAPKGKAE